MRKKKFGSSSFGFFHKKSLLKKRGFSFYGRRLALVMAIGFGGFGVYKLFYANESTSIPIIEAIPGYPIRSRLASAAKEEKKIAPHVEEYITGKSPSPFVEKLLPPPEKPIVTEVSSVDEEDLMEKSILNTIQKGMLPDKSSEKLPQELSKSPSVLPPTVPLPPLKKKFIPKHMQIGPFFFSQREATIAFRVFKKKLSSLPHAANLLIQYDKASKRYRIILRGVSSEEHMKKIQKLCAAQKIPCSVLS